MKSTWKWPFFVKTNLPEIFSFHSSAIMQICWHCNLTSADRLLVDFVSNCADRSTFLWRYIEWCLWKKMVLRWKLINKVETLSYMYQYFNKISRLGWELLKFRYVLPCLAVIAAWTFCRTHVSVNVAFVSKCKLAWDILICWSTVLPVSCFLVGTCLDFLALPVRGFNPTYFLPTFYLSSMRSQIHQRGFCNCSPQ